MDASLIEHLPRPLAFVMGGGASLGAIQVGQLQALREAGIAPDMVVGTSVGALNGVFVAADPDGAAEHLRQLWGSVRRDDIFPRHPLHAVEAIAGREPSLMASSGLAAFVAQQQPAQRLEDLRLPFRAIATDELSGRAVVISQGDLLSAVLASAAVPGLYPPVIVDGVRLVDGGMVANVPISAAFDAGAASVVVCDVGGICRVLQPPGNLMETIVRALDLLLLAQVEREVEHARGRGPILYLPSPCTERVSPLDFDDAEGLTDRARTQTAVFLAEASAAAMHAAAMHGGPHRH